MGLFTCLFVKHCITACKCWLPFFLVLLGVYILIGAGSLVMLVGFFGCCGAVRESQCLLGSVSTNSYWTMYTARARTEVEYKLIVICVLFCFQFFACLLIIFGAEVAAGVFGFLNKDKVVIILQPEQCVSVSVINPHCSTLTCPLSHRSLKMFRASTQQPTMKAITAHWSSLTRK